MKFFFNIQHPPQSREKSRVTRKYDGLKEMHINIYYVGLSDQKRRKNRLLVKFY